VNSSKNSDEVLMSGHKDEDRLSINREQRAPWAQFINFPFYFDMIAYSISPYQMPTSERGELNCR